MSTASPEFRDLARRLLASVTARGDSSDPRADVAAHVIAELRLRLVKLAGVDGFRSLLSRALTLAQAELPSLSVVQVRADGSVEGFDGIEESQEAGQAGVTLVAHLLGLLVTFVGEHITLSTVRDAWPDAFTGEADLRTEGNP